ncbi:hypothetical protein GCM10009733_076230 [Nonomuraea maheshkhaliensis]|uniref:Uncharacterized protein n=1 Tax=Nonomuraea maheshkhaliensis TaxID=419590 RepID=A0ABP4S528_9ACTN
MVVFTAARRDLIERTFAAVEDMSRVVVHLYAATAPTWREVVLGHDRRELRALIKHAAGHVAAWPATATSASSSRRRCSTSPSRTTRWRSATS